MQREQRNGTVAGRSRGITIPQVLCFLLSTHGTTYSPSYIARLILSPNPISNWTLARMSDTCAEGHVNNKKHYQSFFATVMLFKPPNLRGFKKKKKLNLLLSVLILWVIWALIWVSLEL